MAPGLNVLVVGDEKELEYFEEGLDACKRLVGRINYLASSKAIDAVSKLQKLVAQHGCCHAALLSHHFTKDGKEEFSETLRKLLKEKFPEVPIVCWGHPKKGGELGKSFHATLEWGKDSNPADLAAVLKKVQAGEIKAEYLHKHQRKSMDKNERRNSIEHSPGSTTLGRRSLGEAPKRPSMDAGSPTANPRTSVDSPFPRRRSLDRQHLAASEEHPRGSPSLSAMGTFPMGSMALGSMGSVGSMGSMGSGGMGMMPMSPMGGLTPMTPMGGLTPMSPMGGFTPMSPMGGLTPMVPMTNMTNMTNMSGGLTPMTGGMGSAGMVSGMGSLAPMIPAVDGLYGASTNPTTGGLTPMMRDLSLLPAADAPAPSWEAAAPASTPASANDGLIKMLAEEVVRLRKAVEEKRAREAGMGMAPQRAVAST